VSLWYLRGYRGHFRLTHVEETRKRDTRDGSLLRGSPDEKAVNTICTPEATTSLLTVRLVVVPYVVAFFLLLRSCARRSENPRSFSLIVNHAYLEIVEGNEIKFLSLKWVL